MVKETKAKNTNLESPETVDELTQKCEDYAKEWEPVADRIWNETEHKEHRYQNYAAS